MDLGSQGAENAIAGDVHMCHMCGKMFSSKIYFQDHCIVEHSPEALPCDYCDKEFPNAIVLGHHLKAHSRSIHCCNICGKLIQSEFSLYIHLIFSHKYKGESKCDICKTTLSSRQGVRLHMYSKHLGQIPQMEQRAELCCSVHSSRSFPEPECLLDSLLNPEVIQKNPGTDENRVNESASESKAAKRVVISKLVKAEESEFQIQKSEVKSIGNTPLDSVSRIPLQQLDVLDPARELNKAGPERRASDHDQCRTDEQKLVKAGSVPEQSVFSYTDICESGKKRYTCEVCGMTCEDEMAFFKAHEIVSLSEFP